MQKQPFKEPNFFVIGIAVAVLTALVALSRNLDKILSSLSNQ